MKLHTIYHGGDDPFEGDLTVQLRRLPLGARATKATVMLTPVAATSGTLFEETIGNFNPTTGRGDLNVTQVTGTGFVEVDFHARRTLAAVTGNNLFPTLSPSTPGANLQVEVGGPLLDVNARGGIGSLSATDLFALKSDGKLPGLTVGKFRLTKGSANLTVTTVTIRSVPSNITVKLGQTPAFWVRVGELAAADTSPDFVETLNTFLLTASSQDGFYQIPFVIHSDTLARLDVELDIEYVIEQSVLPPQLPEINLPYDFSTLPGADEALTTVRLPRDAVPVSGRTSAQVQGQFQPTRIAQGPIGEELTPVSVEVSPECSLAQAIRVADREIEVLGIDLPLGKTQADVTGLNVALRADDDGKPANDVLASAEVKITKPLPDQSTWGTATLTAPFRLLPGERYWLILQSRDNKAMWNSTTGPAVPPADSTAPLQCSRDGGLSWRAATARDAQQKTLTALLRLREQPDRFSIPLQLQIGTGPTAIRRKLDEYAPLGRIEFNFDFSDKLTEHLNQSAATAPCGSDELLINGSFEQPIADDASERLLGRNHGGTTGTVDLSQGVDLSVEHFLTLSITEGESSTPPPIHRIDCAGANPAHTTIQEIVTRINRMLGPEAAQITQVTGEGGPPAQFLTLRSDIVVEPWCSAEAPFGWQQVSGTIFRLLVERSVYFVMLGVPADPPSQLVHCIDELAASDTQASSEMMQRVTVSGGCTYRVQFVYLVLTEQSESTDNTASAQCQLQWFDKADQLIKTDDMPLAPIEQEGEFNIPPIFEAQLTAPPAAVHAEIHFIQFPPDALALTMASFAPTIDKTNNAQLQQWIVVDHAAAPVGWTVNGGVEQVPAGALLHGTHSFPVDSTLSQTVAVTGDQIYQLTVRASSTIISAADTTVPVEQRPRVELRWFNAEQLIGTPIRWPLDGRDFPDRAWSSPAPTAANRAEIRLIQPRGQGDLSVEAVMLTEVDQVEVPLIFLAETPGELKVSNFRVTYDRPEPPSLLDQLAAIASSQAQSTVPSGRSRRFTAPAAHAEALAAQPATVAQAAGTAPRSPLADQPVTIVAGVGQRYSKILAARRPPVTTIDDLAQLNPNVALKGIPPEKLLELITTAELILALHITAQPFAAVADESIDQLLAMRSATLSRRTAQPNVRVKQLQHDLRALRLLINNAAFRKLRLSDVTST